MPLREAEVSRPGRRTAEALITPALFSQPPPVRREKREWLVLKKQEGRFVLL